MIFRDDLDYAAGSLSRIMNSKAGRCCTVKKQNDAKPPGGQCCVVKLHHEDGGVVLQYSVGDRRASMAVVLLAHYSITDETAASRGFDRSCVAILGIPVLMACFLSNGGCFAAAISQFCANFRFACRARFAVVRICRADGDNRKKTPDH